MYVINYGILLVWFLVFVFAHDWMLHLHGRWSHLSPDLGMSVFKVGIMLLNLVPFVVLSMLG